MLQNKNLIKVTSVEMLKVAVIFFDCQKFILKIRPSLIHKGGRKKDPE